MRRTNRILTFLILTLLVAGAFNNLIFNPPLIEKTEAYTIDGNTVTWENQYGKMEVYPHTSHGLIRQTQYCNLTVKDALAGIPIDVAFRFNFTLHDANIWHQQSVAHTYRIDNVSSSTIISEPPYVNYGDIPSYHYAQVNISRYLDGNYTLYNVTGHTIITNPPFVDWGDIPSNYYINVTVDNLSQYNEEDWYRFHNLTSTTWYTICAFDTHQELDSRTALFNYSYYDNHTIYCGFDSYEPIDSDSYTMTYHTLEWVSIADKFNHITYNGKEYYCVSDVSFPASITQHFKWQYDTPINSNGKWDFIAKLHSDTIQETFNSGRYIMLDPWWNSNWNYYKVCNINANGYSGYYQMKINVTYSSGGDVDCEGHCQADFDDIRFVDIDNSTELPYWIEKKVDSSYAIFWVNVSSNAMSDGKILMYYGNSSATDASDGEATFDFFDDFNTDTSSEYTQDNGIWNWDITNMLLKTATINTGALIHHNTFSMQTGMTIMTKVKTDDTTNYDSIGSIFAFQDTDNFYHARINWYYDEIQFYKWVSGTATKMDSVSFQPSLNTWYKIKVAWISSEIKVFVDGEQKLDITSGLESWTNGKIGLRRYDKKQGYGYFDWLIVRKYASTEPSFTNFGEEQTLPSNTPPTISNPSPLDNAINIDITLSQISATINDPDGDTMSWNIETSPNIGNNSGNDGNDTITCSVSGLDYNTTYTWYVNVSDGNGGVANETYTFTTRNKYIPNPPSPFNATTVSSSQINLTWTKNNSADTTYIERNTVVSWNRGEGTLIYNSTGISYSDTGLDPDTTYYYQAWSYNATDNTYSATGWTAIDLDGSNDDVRVPDDNSLNLTSSFTIDMALWMEDTPADGKYDAIISKMTDASIGWGVGLYSNGTNWELMVCVDGHNESVGTAAIPTNEWIYSVVVFDNSTHTMHVYINGNEIYSYSEPNTPSANTADVVIGECSYVGNDKTFDGKMNYIRVYNKALTEQQVKYNFYWKDSKCTEDGLISWWKFNENTGTTASDSWGSNDGTLEDGATWATGTVEIFNSDSATTEQLTWHTIDTWNGSLDNLSSWNAIDSWSGTVSNIASWQQIETWSGVIANVSQWNEIESWLNNNLYNVSSWQTIQTWTGSVVNTSKWKKIEEINGSLKNTSTWQTVVQWDGSISNTSKWNNIEEWSGSISNTSSWQSVKQWSGSINNESNWNAITSWSGLILNASQWQQIEDWSGEIVNVSSWHLVEDWNGSMLNTSSWQSIETWNGSLYNASSWCNIEQWNGSVYNISSWHDITIWNETIYNTSSWHNIEFWNGSLINISSWHSVEVWNGSLYNISSWSTVQSWNGIIFNESSWHNVQLWNGTLYNQSSWHSIQIWNGTILNESSWSIIEQWNGSIYNLSSWNLIQTFSGNILNTSTWNDIEYWNGVVTNGSVWITIDSWHGSIYNQSSWYSISLWNGNLINSSQFHTISTWSGNITNESIWNNIESFSGNIYNQSLWYNISIWSGTIYNTSKWNNLTTWNGNITSITNWNSIQVWSGYVYNASVTVNISNFILSVGHNYVLGDTILCVATLTYSNNMMVTNATVIYKIYKEGMTLVTNGLFTNNCDGTYMFDYTPTSTGNYMIYAETSNMVRAEVFNVAENYSSIIDNINNSVTNPVLIANFTYFNLADNKGQFIDTSQSSSFISNWTWTIDNITYYIQNPLISFDKTKTINVTLTVTDIYNNTDTISKNVTFYKESFTPYQFVIMISLLSLASLFASIFIFRKDTEDREERRNIISKSTLFAVLSTISWFVTSAISISIGIPYEIIYNNVVISDWNIVSTGTIPIFFLGIALISTVWMVYLIMETMRMYMVEKQTPAFMKWFRGRRR